LNELNLDFDYVLVPRIEKYIELLIILIIINAPVEKHKNLL